MTHVLGPLRHSPSGPKAVLGAVAPWIRVAFPEITFSGDVSSQFAPPPPSVNVSPPFPVGTSGEGQSQKVTFVHVVGIDDTYTIAWVFAGISPPIPGAPFFTGTPFCFSYFKIVPGQVATPQGLAARVEFAVAYLMFIPPGQSYSTGPILVDMCFIKKGALLTEGFPP